MKNSDALLLTLIALIVLQTIILSEISKKLDIYNKDLSRIRYELEDVSMSLDLIREDIIDIEVNVHEIQRDTYKQLLR